MTLSAIAVRLAAAARQEQAMEATPTASSSVYASPASHSSVTINHDESCQDDEIQLLEDQNSTSFEAQSCQLADKIIPQDNTNAPNPTQDVSNDYLTPTKNFRRRKEPTRSNFIDYQCVSKWEPVYEGPNQNISKTVDPNHTQSSIWTLGLIPGQTLIAHGTFQLTVLSGAVDLVGSELRGPSLQPIEVFAPPSHPLPIITAKDIQSDQSAIPIDNLDSTKFSTFIQLRDYHCGIHQLDEVWSSNGNKSPIWTRASRLHPIQGQTWSLILSPTSDLAHLQVPTSWSTSLSSLQTTESNCIYMVEGPKGAGKSTFSTLLINSLLNTFKSVALLDLDPGQPLLTPPTLLSIHLVKSPILGPSFCRLVSPHHPESHSIYLGHTTPKDCADRYVQASLELFYLYLNLQPDPTGGVSKNKRRRHQHAVELTSSDNLKRTDQIPLVINTMGWTKGLGQELLNQLCESIQPSKIFSFSYHPVITHPSEAAERDTKLEPIGSTPLSLRLTPADCRVLTIVSYMHASSGSARNLFINQWDFQHPLWTRRPFEVRPDLLSLPDHPDFNRDHLGHLLNGGLIGFINSSSGWWIGFGLIRAIDPHIKSFHLLTPAYPTCNQKTTEIEFVKFSEPEVPIICYISDGLVPYLEKEIIGGSSSTPCNSHVNPILPLRKKRVRRNVQRRSQILR